MRNQFIIDRISVRAQIGGVDGVRVVVVGGLVAEGDEDQFGRLAIGSSIYPWDDTAVPGLHPVSALVVCERRVSAGPVVL